MPRPRLLVRSVVFYCGYRLEPLAIEDGTYACRVVGPGDRELITLPYFQSAGAALVQGQSWLRDYLAQEGYGT